LKWAFTFHSRDFRDLNKKIINMLLSKMYESCHSNLTGASIRFFTGGHHYMRAKKKRKITKRAENLQRLEGLAKLWVPGNIQHSRLKVLFT